LNEMKCGSQEQVDGRMGCLVAVASKTKNRVTSFEYRKCEE
jgi:hypothetical protein